MGSNIKRILIIINYNKYFYLLLKMNNFSYKDAILNKIPHLVIHKNEYIIEKEEIEDNEIIEKESIVNIKKRVSQIFVEKDSIPLKEDILRLCSHGMYIKIKNINNSHFDKENTNFYIKYMHQKINEIKVWKNEDKNNTVENGESSKKRFNNRIDSIYKTINLIKNKHLEYMGSNIMEDKEGKWLKTNNI